VSLLAVFSYCYRTSCSVTDPTPTTSTGLSDPPQEQPYCQPCLKDGMGKLLQGRDCGFTTQQRRSPITHVKPCAPLEDYKRGARAHNQDTAIHTTHNQGSQHTTTPSEFSYRVASSALSTT